MARESDRTHAGHGFNPLEYSLIEIHQPLALITAQTRVYAEEQQVLCIEAGRDLLQISQRAQKQPCANQQQQRKRHLRNDQ